MTIKSILFAVATAALIGAAVASCPNACSGHGSCGNHDRCKCYATYLGGDCSERTCPYGANGNECSGRGTCDRGAGVCECADGYGGASCQRVKCPNDCSGSGSCDTTTGLCSCAGGYSGNDCSTRLCPKGDDPLTNEVENSGDGSAMQTSEVQTVTFNAGRGLGGTATLTYHDLYGQTWTTRPFSVGGDNVYRLEISIKPGSDQTTDNQRKFTFGYNGQTSAAVTVLARGTAFQHDEAGVLTAATIRKALTPLFATRGARHVEDDRANSVHVYKHNSATSAKIGGSIEAKARITFDIVLPLDMSNHDDNGGLSTAFSASWVATPDVNEQVLNLYSLGDRSAEIESALTSLPNNVVPSVTVAKAGVTDTSTNSAGTWGNAYAQSYTITFNDAANSGDQNMLGCNAEPCDEDGCMNRGTGVSEVRYMHHDPESHGQGINFVSQGYFIMDVGQLSSNEALGAGSIKIMWDTGAGIESAIFALIATASEVQTALRTITGWESVTVELVGVSDGTATVTRNHQFKVTLPAGYDDKGKSPTFYTMKNTDGAYATAVPTDAGARLYDQRFSNSIWLGKTSGIEQCLQTSNDECQFRYTENAATNPTTLQLMPQNGDVWSVSQQYYGTGKGSNETTSAVGASDITHFAQAAASTSKLTKTGAFTDTGKVYYAYLKEGATSVQTSDYFAVGATVEVLPTTWKDDAEQTDVETNVLSKNTYRMFKITGHVTNKFNREFAKLDSFPADDGVARAAADNTGMPKYNLKITSNNGTVHQYADKAVTINVQEEQLLTIGTGQVAKATADVFKLSYKGEESKNMNGDSTPAQIAEEINSFSALSGPVEVTNVNNFYKILFDAKDGDVAQLVALKQSGSDVHVATTKNGWSIEGPPSLGLDTMQAGGTINITAAEECKFTFSGAVDDDYFFCYHGVCSQHTFGTTNNAADFEAQSSIAHIRDDNGHALIDNTTLTVRTPTSSEIFIVTLPSGMSCDPLELRGKGGEVTIKKEVDKRNNGKQFKITRSFMQSASISVATVAPNAITCNGAKQTDSSGCHVAVPDVDAVVFSTDSTTCGAKVGATDSDYAKIFYRTVTSSTAANTGNPPSIAVGTNVTASSSNCNFFVARHVITLNAMPTQSSVSTTLNYVSPVGSCSVEETTKGTQESYECSNRGACDTKSGVCKCYEGYSGQSCQTQTVLV